MKTRFGFGTSVALILLAMTVAADVHAQRRQGARRPGAEQDAAAEKKQQDDSKTTAKKDEPITAVVGGDVYTVSHGLIRRGTVLIQGRNILQVGQDVKPPKGAKIIDATGKYVTPGFVAMRMSGVALRSSRSSSGKPADSLDPFDQNIKRALGVGITAGCVQISSGSRGGRRRLPDERFLGLDSEEPGAAAFLQNPDFGEPDQKVCPCCGLAILSTEPITPSTPTQMTVRKQVVLKMSYGELGPMLASESPVYGLSSSSLAGSFNRHSWRQSIEKAKKYLQDQAAHEKAVKEGKKDEPPRKTVSAELLKLVKKEIYLRVDASSVDQIRDMIALAKELDYKLLLDDVTEGWVVAEELSEARVPVVVTPRRRRSPTRDREDRSGSSIEATGIFERTGVPFAVSALSSSISLNGLAGRDLTSLPLEAAFAVRGGASERAALAALTIVPAQMLGLADRIGSIDPGKAADLLILNGPPLDYRTYVEIAIVEGKVRYDRKQDRVYPVFERHGG